MAIPLDQFLDSLARHAFGITQEEATADRICISCKLPVDLDNMSKIDRDEYQISGFCSNCFAELEDDEDL